MAAFKLPDGRIVEWTPSQWAVDHGLGTLEGLINFGQALPPDALAYLEANSSAPSGDPRDMWNDFVRRQEYAPSSAFGSIVSAVGAFAGATVGFFTGGTLGADIGANIGSGESVSNVNVTRDVAIDAAGLAAGVGLSGAMAAAVPSATEISTTTAVTAGTAEIETASAISTAEAVGGEGLLFPGETATAGAYYTGTQGVIATGGALSWLTQPLTSAAEYLGLNSLIPKYAQQAASSLIAGQRNAKPQPRATLPIYHANELPGSSLFGDDMQTPSMFNPTTLIIAAVVAILGVVALALFRR